MNQRKEIIKGNEISELCEFSLGGYAQKVLIEGKKKDLPVVITLHGGPGTPLPFGVGCRGLFPMFTDHFIMVYWDQLGCGINRHVIDDSFSIDCFVRMTKDLVGHVRAKFPQNKIMIFAMSWGSILSAKLLEKDPRAVDGVIACGQIIRNIFLSDEVKEALRRTPVPKRKLEKIEHITPDHFSGKDLQFISGALRKYTDAYQNKKGAKISTGPIIKGLMTSPDYSMRDFMAGVRNSYRKNTSLWKEILKTDLTDLLGGVEIPYCLLQGDTDIVASTKTARELVAGSHNKNLCLTVVADTGHLPGAEMMSTVLSVLQEKSGEQ